MATTLTHDGEITYASFPIVKTETNEDGDLIVYGKATDGSVDSDAQIVKPSFAYKAIQQWKETGANIRVQHNPQRDPAGVGIGIDFDGDATWVKALVCEPVAKKLVAKGALRAYSVGIARPTIERDVTGKARGGIITDGQIVEISLVDRPANKSCGIQLVKSADMGEHVELVNDVFGDKDTISKMIGEAPQVSKGDMDFQPSDMPDLNFTPNDLADIVRKKIIDQHYNELAIKAVIEEEEAILGKRDIDTATRRSLASRGHALSDGSYPIANAEDLHNAAILARSGHGNAAAAKRLIARRAQELGVANPLDADETKEAVPEIGDMAVPDEVKDQNGQAGPKVPPKIPGSKDVSDEPLKSPDMPSTDLQGKGAGMCSACGGKGKKGGCPQCGKTASPAMKAKKPKAGKKMPPWLNKPDDDGDADDTCKVDHVHTEKCSGTPQSESGAKDAQPMNEAPLPELLTSPAKPHMKAEAANLRFKTIGIDSDMGVLHDLSCPAFHPDEVAKYFPYADFSQIDETVWQQKALQAAAGKSLPEAMEAQAAWQAAVILKNADPAGVYEYRLMQHKAFRDANPGPTTYPSPGAISPTRFHRPNLGGGSGHSKDSPGYGPPNTGPMIPDTAPNAQNFGRPPLTAAHQSPSPSFMKGGMEYPTEQGVPTRISYAELEKEKARRAVSMLHDHMIHQFPSICPINDQDAYRVENPAPVVGPIAGIGKAAAVEDEETHFTDVYKYIRKLEKQVKAGLITEDQARTKLSKRTARRYAESVTEQVQKGLTSRSEILKALGITEPALQKAEPEPEPDVTKGIVSPDVLKTMMSEILAPFQEQITASNTELASVRQQLEERDAQYQALLSKQTQNDQRWEDLANRPDPGTASFAGLAINPLRQQTPAGNANKRAPDSIGDILVRQLERTWRTSENPAEREAAYTALIKYKGTTE